MKAAVKDERQLAVMITTLVALLLISQLSLASERSNSRFFIDSNFFASLETVDLESNNTHHFTPEFLYINSEQKQYTISSWSNYGLTLIYIENHSRTGSIRSPPLSV